MVPVLAIRFRQKGAESGFVFDQKEDTDIKTTYNPYSDRFILKYYQDGKPRRLGGQGYWVLTIEVDSEHTVARISTGIARR